MIAHRTMGGVESVSQKSDRIDVCEFRGQAKNADARYPNPQIEASSVESTLTKPADTDPSRWQHGAGQDTSGRERTIFDSATRHLEPSPSSTPIPIIRLSEWSSHDIDLASRNVEGILGLSAAEASRHQFGSRSSSSTSCNASRESPREHGCTQPFVMLGQEVVLDIERTLPASRRLQSRGLHNRPHETSNRVPPPPPLPRVRPAPPPYARLPPKIELPPPSPATTSLSSSPSSLAGVSMIACSPPECRLVQVRAVS